MGIGEEDEGVYVGTETLSLGLGEAFWLRGGEGRPNWGCGT